MALINYDDYSKEAKNFYAQQKQQALADKGALFDQQTGTVNDNYDYSILEAGKAYDDSYRENAIQKLINERQVAENMANMGITNSGLNRSQQTAVQLSYANQKAAIDRQKQQQIDTLERDRATALSDIAASRQGAIDSINQYYDGLELERANSRYNTDVDAANKLEIAKIEAQNKIDLAKIKATQEAESNRVLYTYTGQQKVDDNGNIINIYRDSSGKEYKMKEGFNPYTGADNNDKYAYEKEQYGFFKNGYQPKGIKGYGPVKAIDSINITGKPQNVWRTSTRNGYQYWIWSGQDNKYISVVQKNGEWIIP